MAYQRFVSYIYEYSGGKKDENRGFVRVETKNGICQMGFWLKIGDLPEKSRIQVFGLIREKARLLGVSAGELLSCPGGVRGQVNFPERQIGSSPYRMDQLGGLLLCTAGGRRFATQWDDEPLRLEWFEEWQQKQEAEEEQRMPEEADREKTEEKEEREPGNPAVRQNMEFREKDSEENTGEEWKISEQTEWEKTEQRENENLSGEMKKTDGNDKTEGSAQTERSDKTERSGKTEETDTAGEKRMRLQTEPAEDDRAVPLAAEIPVMSARDPGKNPDTTRCKFPGCPQPQNRPFPGFHRWEQVQKTCAHCQPFHDDLMTDCVKVTRQELPQLRKIGWQLDSNQFQNHGLNLYGHLLLCRDASRPDAFFVCVPGMFNTNEQFMAGMFGYHAFRPAKPTAEGAAQPNFGYWCRRIPMPRG